MKWKESHDNDYYIEHFQKEVLGNLDVYKTVHELHLLLPNEVKAVNDYFYDLFCGVHRQIVHIITHSAC